jgi:mono/diheme cytochrome c family protein
MGLIRPSLLIFTIILLSSCEKPVSVPAKGKQMYTNYCSNCHGDKLDNPQLDASNLMYSTLLKVQMRRIVKEGVLGTNMPSFDKVLNEKEIESIVKYIDEIKSSQ